MNRVIVFSRYSMWSCILLFFSVHSALSIGLDLSTKAEGGTNNSCEVNLVNMPLFQFVYTELKRPGYSRDILPYDFSYLYQLLTYGKTLRHHRQNYVRSVFGIFSNVMGASHDITATAFETLLELLPNALKPYTVLSVSSALPSNSEGGDLFFQDRFKNTVSSLLFVQFSSQFDRFKTEPVLFFDELAHRIADIGQQEMDMQLMRTAIKRFIELGLSKLVWQSNKPETIWPSVKNIAQHLMQLTEHNIIDDLSDLNDIYWTLIHRFNYYIDILNAHFPQSFYQEIRNDLNTDSLSLLMLAEQDTCIQTKKECLMRALIEAEAKRLAYEKGIVLS